MKRFSGIAASRGIVRGSAVFYKPCDITVTPERAENPEAERVRFAQAQRKAVEDIDHLCESAVELVGAEAAQIFEVHKMMVEADEFVELVTARLDEGYCAPYAVQQAGQELAAMFSSMDDDYMKERAADVSDISSRLIRIMLGVEEGSCDLSAPCILVADDLLPSDTISLDSTNVLAFVTRLGSHTSHLAILARTRGIPAVVGLGAAYEELSAGVELIVDGTRGTVIVEPGEAENEEFDRLYQEHMAFKKRLQQFKGLKSVTQDGTEVEVCANIGSTADIRNVLENDADGIGLVRSEFLYMESEQLPDEDVLFEAYRTIVSKMGGKRVIIRTLDVGADKALPYLALGHEDNPAIGFRAVRVCLKRPDIFYPQLRAILRASVYGKTAIMFPMISGLEEFRQSKQMTLDCMEQLRQEGIPFDEKIPIGLMIEIPAAAVLSGELAAEADFFSIGTNDLTQFMLAADRMNPNVDHLFNGANEAVLRMIEFTAKSAAEHGILCGICGELGADTTLTERFLKMGVREFSVAPHKVLEVREKVRSICLPQA